MRMKNKRYILLSFINFKYIICEYGESFVFEYLYVFVLYCVDFYFVFKMINFIFLLIWFIRKFFNVCGDIDLK